MTSWLTAFRVQLRHLRPFQLLVDLVMRTAVGALTMFVLLLASFQPFDALVFEAGLRYDTREVVDSPPTDRGGVWLSSSQGTMVMAAAVFDDTEGDPAAFVESVTPRVWSSSTHDRLAPVLQHNLVSGTVSPGQVVIDEATSAVIGASPGDELVLRTGSNDCRVAVSGVVRSYQEITGDRARGLLVVPSDACGARFFAPAEAEPQYLLFDGRAPSRDAESWAEHVWSTFLTAGDAGVSGLLLPILVVGLIFWTLLGLRNAALVLEQLRFVSELLFDLGCRSARVRQTHLIITSTMTLIAAVGAAWGAREALWHMASFHIQAIHWLSIGLLFAFVTIAINYGSHRRACREASRVPRGPRSGAAPTRTPAAPVHR